MSQDDRSLAAEKIQRMLTGAWIGQAVYAVAKLNIAELLRDGPKSAAELARTTGTHEEALYRLLRTVVSLGIFTRSRTTFALNPLGEVLLPDADHSKWAMAVMLGEEHHRAWGEILYSIRTGLPAFDHIYGEGIFDYLGKHPEQGKIFDAAMTNVHGRETAAMIAAYDFSPFQTLVDVGGGNGSLIATILKRYPALRGMLYDLPHVVERAKPRLAAEGVAERCEAVGGSFFESVPQGADAYLMRHIIHDWDDERAQAILRNCRAAMKTDGRVLLIEAVIPESDELGFGKLLDLNMLVMPGGKERTAAEYQTLFAACDLRLLRVVPTDAEVQVIEATAA
jgi:hypothetical protein